MAMIGVMKILSLQRWPSDDVPQRRRAAGEIGDYNHSSDTISA